MSYVLGVDGRWHELAAADRARCGSHLISTPTANPVVRPDRQLCNDCRTARVTSARITVTDDGWQLDEHEHGGES